MIGFCPTVFCFRNKEKSGSQPACLDHMQDRRALSLKAHQSESYLPIGRSLGMCGERVAVYPDFCQAVFSAPSGHPLWGRHRLQVCGSVSRCETELGAFGMLAWKPPTGFQGGRDYSLPRLRKLRHRG